MNNLYLVHHGIKGQKWGVRRFQNEDGSLTPEGKRRYYALSPEERRREFRSNKNYYGRTAAKRIRANREAGMTKAESVKGEHRLDRLNELLYGRRTAEKINERIRSGEDKVKVTRQERAKAVIKSLAGVAIVYIALTNMDKIAKISKGAYESVKRAMYVDPNIIDLKPSQYRQIFEIAGYLHG